MRFFDRFKKRSDSQPPPPRQRPAAMTGTPPASHAALVDQPRFVVLDVETTGLSASSHRIVEIALVSTDISGRVLDEWSTRIDPQGPVGATHIHGITEGDVAHMSRFNQLVDELTPRLQGAAVSAHNAKFDLAFLRAEYARAGWEMPFMPALCTLEASQYHLPDLPRRRLADCCAAVGQPLEHAHSALGDARSTAGPLAAFMNPQFGLPPRPADFEIPQRARYVAWPSRPSERPVVISAPPRGFSSARTAFSAQALRNIAAASGGSAPGLVEVIEKFSLVNAVDEGSPSGAVAYLEKVAEVLERVC